VIITAPTALYDSILPKAATTPGNMTFTISSNDPPRTQSFVSQLSSAADYQDLPTRVYTNKERRASLGNMIFSVSYGAKGPAGFGQKMFEVGQTLSFEDTTTDLTEVQVSNNLDLQQNLNLLNLEAMGLTTDQIARLIDSSNEQFNKLVIDLNMAFTNINNAKTAISDNQKKINETSKALDAAQTVYTLIGQGKDIVDSLTTTKAGLEQAKVDLIAYYNGQVTTAELIVGQILNVREVVR